MFAVATRLFELRQLRKENHDGKAVHKPQHHRMRHQSDELPPMHHPRNHLQDAHENHSRKEIFDAVVCNQGNHHHRQRASRAGNHTRTPPDQRRNQPYQKRCIKPHQRVHTRDKGKRYSLRHQRQCDRQPRQKLGAHTGHGKALILHDGKIGRRDILGQKAQYAACHDTKTCEFGKLVLSAC